MHLCHVSGRWHQAQCLITHSASVSTLALSACASVYTLSSSILGQMGPGQMGPDKWAPYKCAPGQMGTGTNGPG